MANNYSSNCFSTANVIQTDMQNVENNFECLRSMFSSNSAPASPVAGQMWYDTGTTLAKIYYNSSWDSWWDFDYHAVAAGGVKTDSLAAGILSTDSTGRAKMANGFITNAHVADVDVSKVSGLNKAAVLMGCVSGTPYPILGVGEGSSQSTFVIGRVYIPNTGAAKLYASFSGNVQDATMPIQIQVGTSSVSMATMTSAAVYIDSSTYVNVTSWLGSLQTVTMRATCIGSGSGNIKGLTLYLTT